jgi:hypothetical protein
MSLRIAVGRYVAFRKPSAGAGWWFGKVVEDRGNGFFRVKVILAENPSEPEFTNVKEGKAPMVFFHRAKEAYRFMRKKMRAQEHNSAKLLVAG